MAAQKAMQTAELTVVKLVVRTVEWSAVRRADLKAAS
jgi:hypothetical protein